MTTGIAYVPARHPGVRGLWTAERVVGALRDWTRETGAPPRRCDWSGERAEAAGTAQRKWMREHPRWPSSSTVAAHHGSWTAALAVAELVEAQRPAAHAAGARVEAARRRRAEGESIAAIATALGVSSSTVYAYLAAAPCPRCGTPVVRQDAERCAGCRGPEPTVQRAWSRDEVRTALTDWAVRDGQPPTVAQWTPSQPAAERWVAERPRWPSAAMVCGLYAGQPNPWNAALIDAGLEPNLQRFDVRDFERALAAAWARTGRIPRAADLGAGGPAARTFRTRYGGVGAAWHALRPVPADPGN